MKSPLVSVVVPVYNTGYNIAKVSKCILDQPYRNIELILVNDGSVDDSLRAMRDLKKHDQRVKIFSQDNAGPAAARNTGVNNARGKFIVFVDSDDIIEKNMINKMVSKINDEGLDFVGCGLKYVNLKTGTSHDENTKSLKAIKKDESFRSYITRLVSIDGRMYGLLGKIYRKEVLDKFNIRFDEKHNYGEDLLFNLDFLSHTTKPIFFIPEALYVYHYGTSTSISSKSALVYKNWQKNFSALRKFADNAAGTRKYLLKIKLHWIASYAKLKLKARKVK